MKSRCHQSSTNIPPRQNNPQSHSRHLLVAPNYSATSVHTLLAQFVQRVSHPCRRFAVVTSARSATPPGLSHGSKISTNTQPNIHNPHDRLCSCLIVEHITIHLFKAHRSSASCREGNVSLTAAQSSHPKSLSRPLPTKLTTHIRPEDFSSHTFSSYLHLNKTRLLITEKSSHNQPLARSSSQDSLKITHLV